MQVVEFKHKLGSVVKEKITGFTGVVMSQVNHITGCKQYGILTRELTNDGKTQDWSYYDEDRLFFTGEIINLQDCESVKEEPKTPPVGGDSYYPNADNQGLRNS